MKDIVYTSIWAVCVIICIAVCACIVINAIDKQNTHHTKYVCTLVKDGSAYMNCVDDGGETVCVCPSCEK